MDYLGYGQSVSVSTRPSVVVLNGWGANGHVGDYEGAVNQGHSVPLATDPGTTNPYTNPNNAFDGDTTSAASCAFVSTHQYAGCVWGGFPARVTGGGATLSVVSEVPAGETLRDAGIWYSLDAGVTWTLIYQSAGRVKQQDNVALPFGVDLTQLQVMAFTDSHDNMAHNVFEIFVKLTLPPASGVTPADSKLMYQFGPVQYLGARLVDMFAYGGTSISIAGGGAVTTGQIFPLNNH